MILSKPGKPNLAQVRVEVAKRLRKEVWIAVLKSGEAAKDEQSLRTVRHLRSQRYMIHSSAELYEVLADLKSDRVGELCMSFESPIVA